MSNDTDLFSCLPYGKLVGEMEQLISTGKSAFLLGAGCSCCAGLPLTDELTAAVLDSAALSTSTKDYLSNIVEHFRGSGYSTIEDYMSELVDMLSIAERRKACESNRCRVTMDSISGSPEELRDSISEIQAAIANCISEKTTNLQTHREFVHAIHASLRSGRNGGSQPVDYFVLNYDTLIEDALALERVTYTDGLRGGTTGWWDQSSFSEPAFAARVFKLHGSIDWCCIGDETLPRRVRSGLEGDRREHVMIWPAATKYRETQRDPYAQIIGFMRDSLCSPDGTEAVLAICGYRFADAHINLEIERALRQSDKRLTVIAFSSDVELAGELGKWLTDPLIGDQVRVYSKRGFYHGSESIPSDNDLPWWRFETITRLLGGSR